MIHSFLLIGQSNMAGRGYLKEVPVICNERIKMFRNGLWQLMLEPIHYDRPFSGIGLGASFADSWCRDNKDDEVGLIPCAEGDSSLDDWSVEGSLFQNALFQAKLAQKTSTIEGILWHQGENDCNPTGVKEYNDKFNVIIHALRKELNIPDVPLMIGGLGDYLTEGMYGNYFTDYIGINKALTEFADAHPDCHFVTASKLTSNPDKIHFNAQSQRLFGLRYYEAYAKRCNIVSPLENEEAILDELYKRSLSKNEKKALTGNEFGKGNITLFEYMEQISLIDCSE